MYFIGDVHAGQYEASVYSLPSNAHGKSTIVLRSPDVGPAILFREFDAAAYLRQVPLVPFDDEVDHRLEAFADVHVVAVPGGVLSRRDHFSL